MNRQELLKDYAVRLVKLVLSLTVFGLGNYFMVKASAFGMNAWLTFQYGLTVVFPITIGQSMKIVSAAIIVADIIMKGKIGIGSIANAILVGSFLDVFNNQLDFLPDSDNKLVLFLYLFAGMVIVSNGTALYMKAQLGCGPRDTLMVIFGNKLRKLKIGTVKFIIEGTVFVIGILLGAPLGIGSVIGVVGMSYVMQFVFTHIYHGFEPRDLVHETFRDTYLRIKNASK